MSISDHTLDALLDHLQDHDNSCEINRSIGALVVLRILQHFFCCTLAVGAYDSMHDTHLLTKK